MVGVGFLFFFLVGGFLVVDPCVAFGSPARARVGRTYYFAKADARLPKGRFFIDDLLGCEVLDAETGRVYGTLTVIDRPAAQDIYTVTDAEGGTHMLPAVPEFVKKLDPENRRILVTPIEGMFSEAVNGDKD